MKMNVQSKLIGFTMVLIVVIVFFFSRYSITNTTNLLLDALQARGISIANGIANNCQFGMLAEDLSNLANFVDSAMKEKDVSSVAIINKDGKFLAHSVAAKVGQMAKVSEEKQALEANAIRTDKLDNNTIVITVPVVSKISKSAFSGGAEGDLESMMGLAGKSAPEQHGEIKKETIGAVQMFMSTARIQSEIKYATKKILTLTVLIALAALFVIIVLSRWMFNPLRQIARKIQKISQGEIEDPVKFRSSDEIGDLALAFNDMVKYVGETAQNARAIAQGDLSVNVQARSDKDVLGSGFREMLGYLQETAQLAQKISQGNLSSSFKARSQKDAMGNALSTMITGLRQLIAQIQDSSNKIHARANEMASLSQASTETVSQMASNVSQISTSIAKISETTQVVSSTAQKTAGLAETGNESISGIIEKVLRSKNSAAETVELIKNLNKSSMQIGEIINYITKVADQTNLLSLNAAIEAARAGEAGRGFAVVADEVRKLAEGSAHSASEIARLIREVQTETSKVVGAVEMVAKEVGESADVTQTAGKHFREISQSARTIAAQIENIAASFEETAASVQEISASSEEQVSTFEEISNSIETLKDVAEVLRDASAKFKLT
jgi:methyl-accepting chemotaxis protein